MRLALPRTVLVLVVLALALAAGTATAPATATPTWAPAGEATIHPGVQTFTDGAQCTANFVFTGDDGRVYLGQAAHCAGLGSATDTDGCTAESHPIGTPVEFAGVTGTLAYSSWLTMQKRGEDDADTCQYNDFALIEIAAGDVGNVNPSIPFWGGPEALGHTTAPGEDVYSYGNSSLRLGLTVLSPKQGTSLGQTAGGWNHPVYTATPGVPGDSGSAFLDAAGDAVGTLSTLAIAPLAGSNGVTDIALALAYANDHGGLGTVTLATGTEPFEPLL